MTRIYPISLGEPQSARWRVTVDGEAAPVRMARVSAYPINRRWPGHQRSVEETEIAGFVQFECDGKAEVAITPRAPYESVIVRPLSRGVAARRAGDTICLTLPGPGQYTVETDGSHRALHLFADPPCHYDVDRDDPSVIWFGKGIHEAGTIRLSSGQTLYLDEGAVVYGRVEAVDAHDIRILGRGILDGSRNHERVSAEMGKEQREAYEKGWAVPNATRQHTVELSYCDRVAIHGVTIRDSLVYNIRPVCCRDLTIENVKIIGSWRYNSDGIDMHNCRDVVIRGCFVRTFDDCICIKGFDYTQDEADMRHGGALYDTFQNILIEQCVIWCDWGRSLEFGAETRAREISGAVLRDCDLIHNSFVAMDIQNVDYAVIHDVLFEDIRVEYDAVTQRPRLQQGDWDAYTEDPSSAYMPDLIGCHVTYVPEYSAGGARRGVNRDITFRSIHVYAPHMPPSALTGFDDEHPTESVTIDGLYLNGRRIASLDEANVRVGPHVRGVRLT